MEKRSRPAGLVACLWAVLCVASMPSSATEDPLTGSRHVFVIEWSGALYGNDAAAQGVIVFDDYYWPGPTRVSAWLDPLPAPGILDLSLTVTNDDGTIEEFSLGDFSGINFTFPRHYPAPVDLTRELVGRAIPPGIWYLQPDGLTFGACEILCGDFNLFSNAVGVPDGTNFFILTLADGSDLRLISLAPIPEPSSALLLLLGVVGISISMHRRRPAQHRIPQDP